MDSRSSGFTASSTWLFVCTGTQIHQRVDIQSPVTAALQLNDPARERHHWSDQSSANQLMIVVTLYAMGQNSVGPLMT